MNDARVDRRNFFARTAAALAGLALWPRTKAYTGGVLPRPEGFLRHRDYVVPLAEIERRIALGLSTRGYTIGLFADGNHYAYRGPLPEEERQQCVDPAWINTPRRSSASAARAPEEQ